MDPSAARLAGVRRLLQRIEHEVRVPRAGDTPADEPAGERVAGESTPSNPSHVATSVLSAAHRRVGLDAVNLRWMRAAGRSARSTQIVVRPRRSRTTPARPNWHIRRSTVPRARRSNSASPQNAEALRRISLPSLSSRVARSKRVQPVALRARTRRPRTAVTFRSPHRLAQRLSQAAAPTGGRLHRRPRRVGAPHPFGLGTTSTC
jgi:hypothetical protein